MKESETNFLLDFIELVLDRAREAQRNCNDARASADIPSRSDFECGRAIAYYEVVSLLKGQAELFDLAERLGISQLNPDDLLK